MSSGYAATPWPAEDGGPRRQGRPAPGSIPGPRATGARLAASRDALVAVMVLLGPGEDDVLVLRNSIGPDGATWVERVHPESLEELDRSPDLALGPFWPGGFAVLDDGAVLVVQGCWAHRLAPDLSVERSRRLPVEAPYNSFVLLGDGTVATKDLQRPEGTASTLSLLDPVTLEDRAAPIDLGEPSVARLGADGDDVVVVGVTGVRRWRWEGPAASLVAGNDHRYLVHEGQSFGWDAVVDGGATWWMDNGDHAFVNGFTMLGNGVAPGPVRLWKLADGATEPVSVEISGQPHGAVTNPPLVDPERGVVVAFDSANGVLAGFAADDLAPRWRTALGAASHMVHFPDTGELLVNDFRPGTGDALAVVDVASGEVRARCDVASPAQSVVFPAPGRRRDAYFVSLSTLARVEFTS